MFNLDDAPRADLETITETLTAELPEPQQHAIDQSIADAAADPEQAGTSGDVQVDALGVPWNESQHAKGADGKGIKTAKGTWRKRRGVRGSAPHLNTDNASKDKGTDDDSASQERVRKETLEHQNRMAGAMAGTMLVRISAAVGGQEFLPRDITVPGGLKYNEEQFLQSAFGDYFVAKGISDIPPGLVLCSALMMYYMPRFQSPVVRERAGGVVRWFRDKARWIYFKIKDRKGGAKPDSKSKKSRGSDPALDTAQEVSAGTSADGL